MTNLSKKLPSRGQLRGFSLIEVMLAVLVLSIGILAVSKLQTSLLRSGADANNRSIAASIAQQKVDDLRRFVHLNSSTPGIGWDAIAVNGNLKYPASLAFDHIADNKGGRIQASSITVGGQAYNLTWSIADYHFDGAGSTATPITPDASTLKIAHVKVTWDSVGSTTNNVVSFDTALYGYNLKNTALAGSPASSGAGEVNLTSSADEIFDNGNGSSFGHEEIAPEISNKGSSILTKTVSTTFRTIDRVILTRDEFRTVACPCKNGPNNTEQIYYVPSWDNVNKNRTDVQSLRNDTITKTAIAPIGGDASTIANECTLCCEQGLGADGDPGGSNKICRLKLIGGRLFMYDPWKPIGFNIIPESFFTEGQTINGSTTGVTTTEANRSSYVNYLGTLIRQVLLNYTTTAQLYALTTVDTTFPITATFNDGSINHALFNSGADRQLQARVLYLDLPAQGSYEGTTYTATNIPLERIPFFELNLTKLAGWTPDVNLGRSGSTTTGDTSFDSDYTDDHDALNNSCNTSSVSSRSFVTNEELVNKCENDFNRGYFDAKSGDGTVNTKAGIFTGNNGLVDRGINTETIAITSMDISAP